MRWWQRPGWALLPLRLFLGGTYLYAGLTKLLDPAFLDPAAPTSIAQQLAAVRTTSPVAALVGLAQHQPQLVGGTIAVAEIAVGLGTLVGLWTRLAAVGGALLALSFFLTVSWRTRPYYYGSDVVFLAAWLSLVIAGAGAGGVQSLDTVLGRRAREPDARRRGVLSGVGATAALAAVGGSVATAAALVGRDRRRRQQRSGFAPGGPELVVDPATVPVGGAVAILDPGTRLPAYVVQPSPQRFAAFSAVCSHAGCTVDFGGDGTFRCPCHGGVFDAATGAVVSGPPPAPLGVLPVAVRGGQLHVGVGPPAPSPAADVGTHGDD